MMLHRAGVEVLPDGQVEYDVAEIVGPYTWSLLHHAVETFPCEHCREEGTRLLHGLHDVVNAELGKPIKFPEDLKFLAAHVDKAIALLPKEQSPAGKLSGAIEAEIERLARGAGFLSARLEADGDPPEGRWSGKCSQQDPELPPECDLKVTRKGRSAGNLDVDGAMVQTLELLKDDAPGPGGAAGPAESLTVELSGSTFTLGPETLQAMVKANKDTGRTGREHGFAFCDIGDGVLMPGPGCVGNSCSIRLEPCPSGVRTAGGHHTHPGTLDQQLVQSVADLSFRRKGSLECMSGPKRDRVICASLKADDPKGFSVTKPKNAAKGGWSYLHPENDPEFKAAMRKGPKTRLAFGMGKQFNFLEFPLLQAQGKLPDGELDREFPRCGTAKAEQWERCVQQVKSEGTAESPFAVCTAAVGCSPS